MQVRGTALMGAALALALATAGALAQDPAAVIAKRQEAMKALGGHMKAINDYVESGVGSPPEIEARAREMAAFAPQIPSLFPEGTSLADGVGKTGAKSEIWADWAGFQAAAAKLEEESLRLAEVAAAGDKDAIAAQFGMLGKNGCGGCHTPFRQKLD